MARYFMGDTCLAGLERMMMDPSRRVPIQTDTRRKRPQKKPPRSQPPLSPARKTREGGV